MDIYLPQELLQVISHSVQDITSRLGGIELAENGEILSDDTCTVHTILEGAHRAALLLCADTALLTRLAQKIMHREAVTAQDIEDVTTEYFNIICGRVAAGFFQSAHISSRFHTPSFCPGRYLPEACAACQYVFNYSSGNKEGVQLVYMGLHPSDTQLSA